ncbi:MAG: hypothetical protein K0S53_395 [Bacteroidetes bacterium]|jgi:hypothetical protein|nr:hypothetical protein [Bacteroidota bacterium]
MSRTINQIKQTLDDAQALQPELSALNSPSQTSIYNLWKYITAVAIWIHESLLDLFKAEIETTISKAPVGTESWVTQKCFDFQYDSTTPQIVQMVDFVPNYDPIDDTKKIITRCSVKTLPNKIVTVKLAKEEPPVPLTTPELNSIQGYLDDISFAGVQYNTTSTSPDYLYLNAEIFYNGQYAAIISATTITAINNYLSTIPFDGQVRIASLEDAIQAVGGVTDLVISDLALRANAVPFSGATYMVQNKTTVYNKYGLSSGYVVPELTPNDLSVSLTFTTE